MNPAEAYKKQIPIGWTRVDMLLALYASSLKYIDQAIIEAESGNVAGSMHFRTRVSKIVLELAAGVDLSYGEIPTRMAQLYDFVQANVLSGDAEQLRNARGVLVTLQEAFQGIRDEAVELEANGKIPPLELSTSTGQGQYA